MKKPYWILGIALALMAAIAWSIYPPAERLKLGKDLRGGVTLVYAVENPDNSKQMLDSLIEVLKERIDPGNQLDISFVPQGLYRLEITMPLPNEAIKQRRDNLDAAIDALGRTIRPGEVERAMREQGEARERAILSIAGPDKTLAERLGAAAVASDAAAEAQRSYEGARDAYEAAKSAGIPESELGALDIAMTVAAANAARAERTYDEARTLAVSSVFDPLQLRRALLLSDRSERKWDKERAEHIVLPSERGLALDRVRASVKDNAQLLAGIDRVVAQYTEYESSRRTLDDADDLIRLLRGAGVLEFRISVGVNAHPEEASLRQKLQESGPESARARDAAWYKINKITTWANDIRQLDEIVNAPAGTFAAMGYVVEFYDGGYYMLLWDTPGKRLTRAEGGGNWSVAKASAGQDQFGRPAIDFQMDPNGASELGRLTAQHVQQPMAILLDDQVYTAPTLNSAISRSGQIHGSFPQDELTYIIRTLNAGALQSKLSPQPISQNRIGPEFGLENLRMGRDAGIISLVVVGGFMLIYYFPTCGGVAVFSLICNALMILAWMSWNRWAFTLPGIAGIVLTFGMAVDANVLIYERMREEYKKGADFATALRLGFSKAMSSIIDGNVTNLIVCFVLGLVGTQEIKGFAYTLGTGVVMTLLSVLVLGRLIFDTFVLLGMKKTSMLPMAIPAIDRVLEPRINWLRLKPVFIVLSTIYVSIGIGMVVFQNKEMLDIEFRAGTQVSLRFKDDAQPMRRKDVEDRLDEIASAAAPDSSLARLRSAEVLVVNPEADDPTLSRSFNVRALISDTQGAEDMEETIAAAFADQLDLREPISFARMRAFEGFDANGRDPAFMTAPVYPVTDDRLGYNFSRPQYLDDASAFRGGGAILIEGITPAVSLADITSRIETTRNRTEFASDSGRTWEVRVLEGTQDAVTSAVFLFMDPNIRYITDPEAWTNRVAEREWYIVSTALSRPPSLGGVVSFSAQMADSFRAAAVLSVVLSFLLTMMYIWVRFGSLRYSVAAIACLLHDVLTVIGLVALVEILYLWPPTEGIIGAIGLRPFKINLDMIAAILTIIGYSLNDTIIVMDRIRENRGRLPYAKDDVINTSINQTISRTVITSGTTLLAVLILYTNGGEGVRGFAFALLIGIGVGTYSSIAVAAPLVRQKIMGKVLPTPAREGETT